MNQNLLSTLGHVLALPPGIALITATTTPISCEVFLHATCPTSACPRCHTASSAIHSHYQRTLRDLPWGGLPVVQILQVRKFFCQQSTCPQRIFTERLPSLVHPSARKTRRAQACLQTVAFACGGEGGARLVPTLGLAASPATLLTLIQRWTPPVHPAPRIIGMDDWAWRKRLRYGTIVVDLERHRIIDILPDRQPATVMAWMQQHPTITTVARDRSGGYAEAIAKSAPTVQHVADRWHLAHNLADALERILLGKRQVLTTTAAQLRGAVAAPPDDYSGSQARDGRSSDAAWVRRSNAARQRRHAQYLELYAQIRLLHSNKAAIADIAELVGVSRRTVYRYVAMDGPPTWQQPTGVTTSIAPYTAYLRHRWSEGCFVVRTLWQEIQAQGYHGSEVPIRRFIQRNLQRPGGPQPLFAGPGGLTNGRTPSVGFVATLFLLEAATLAEREQTYVTALCVADAMLAEVYTRSQEFMHLIRHREEGAFERWLARARASEADALHRFATGLVKDQAAVSAGLTLEWSNGQTEGHVNRLKVLKRAMYGRAGFDLLRQRVLFHAENVVV